MTGEDAPQFVLHEHFAHHYHFNFRFEKQGELKSWSAKKSQPLKKPLVGKQ
jgi:hypothetical protein